MKLLITLIFIFALTFGVRGDGDKSACLLPKDSGPCRALIPMFHYDTQSKECKEFAYGGCEGNANAFSTKEQCEKLCKV